jgi:hypothetical protein
VTAPLFMTKKPAPAMKQRLYNGRHLQVWEGRVRLSDITGWVDNPRIDIAKQLYQDKVGQRELEQDEILDIMKSDASFKLKALRDDILKNGLREPLILSFSGKLLDGNRRFFALRYALEGMRMSDPRKPDLEMVDAYVLAEDVSEEEEDNVLVEENFSPSLKLEWPDYVKAQKVVGLRNLNFSDADIALRLNWSAAKVRETIRIDTIIQDFEAFAVQPIDEADKSNSGLGLGEQEAKSLAAANYQYFNEAQKSFFGALNTDIDFKLEFFRWIVASKFDSFAEVRIAHKAYQNPEASAIISKNVPGAAKAAKAALDYNARLVNNADEASLRIGSFVNFLRQLKADEIKSLPREARENLAEALALISKMSKAVEE